VSQNGGGATNKDKDVKQATQKRLHPSRRFSAASSSGISGRLLRRSSSGSSPSVAGPSRSSVRGDVAPAQTSGQARRTRCP